MTSQVQVQVGRRERPTRRWFVKNPYRVALQVQLLVILISLFLNQCICAAFNSNTFQHIHGHCYGRTSRLRLVSCKRRLDSASVGLRENFFFRPSMMGSTTFKFTVRTSNRNPMTQLPPTLTTLSSISAAAEAAVEATTTITIDPIKASIPTSATSPLSSKAQKSMLFFFTSTATKILKMAKQKSFLLLQPLKLQQAIHKTTILKTILSLILVIFTFRSVVDAVQTRKRQCVDATSEWGRYADYPSVRGRALFALMSRIGIYMIVARVINSLPGGEYPLFRNKVKIKQGRDRNRDGDDRLVENTIANNAENDNNLNLNDPKENENGKKSSLSSWSIQKATQIRTYSGNKLAEGLLRLGPLYVKIGQIISCQEKLLPDEWKVALERLQDRVPAKSGNEALQLAFEAYDGNENKFYSIFSEFDDVPLAAASLGQVHRARLKSNNATVAIKLQRSRLRDIYDKDLALMNKIARAVDKFAGKMGNVGGVKQSWEDIFKDAETILYREIDYRDEATNAMRFASDFGIGINGKPAVECTAQSLDGKVLPSAASWIRTPYIYDEYSTEKILVMEYVPSIKISEDAKLRAAGLSLEDREYLAECLARAYLRQFCVNKFFSTDPHPGNLGVEIISNKDKAIIPRLVFYDFGQACALKDEQSGGILDVIEGIVDTNVDNCVDAFIRMGVLVDGADLSKIRNKVQKNFETGLIKVKNKKRKTRNKSGSNGDVSFIKSEELDTITISTNNTSSSIKAGLETSNGEDINDGEIMSFFTLPAEYAFVARAISQMDGVGKGLDADFDFISASAPYLVEIKGGEKYVADEVKKMISPILAWQNNLLKKAGYDIMAKKNKNKMQ